MHTPDQKHGPAPFSLPLSLEERRQPEAKAASTPLGAYIRGQLFRPHPHRDFNIQTLNPTDARKLLAQVLGKLGQSELAQSLAQLPRAAHIGALPLTPETEAALRTAARDTAEMKRLLMAALRIQER